jgi:molecular chaperone HtpG
MNAEFKAASAALRSVPKNADLGRDWQPTTADVVIGKDVLELLSTSMYVDPMSIYREYVQNAADAIDDVRRAGQASNDVRGSIDILIDAAGRTIKIRDDGTGIKSSSFARQLTALGASSKRGTLARGFRGVGRLAGLGYAQELVFRSRVAGETHVSEMRWDCRKLLATLRDTEFIGGLADIIQEVVSVREILGDGFPERFFEVEMKGVTRHKNDILLNSSAVAEYLSQVGPVPFAPDFRFGPEITAAIAAHGEYSYVDISISGMEGPLYRPHRDTLELGQKIHDEFTELELVHIPGSDGSIGAVAWILHHGYTGALPNAALVKGLRLRCGNIQVGAATLLEDLFPETRFNSWSVGEVHVFDKRVVPNGRRDHFQSSVHFNNIVNHLAPVAREIARRCRTASVRRNLLRQFEFHHQTVREKIGILDQGALGPRERNQIERAARASLSTMEKIAEKDELDTDGRLKSVILSDEKKLSKVLNNPKPDLSLNALPPAKRKMYEHLFSLVYECSTNRSAAKALIDRILLKIG